MPSREIASMRLSLFASFSAFRLAASPSPTERKFCLRPSHRKTPQTWRPPGCFFLYARYRISDICENLDDGREIGGYRSLSLLVQVLDKRRIC